MEDNSENKEINQTENIEELKVKNSETIPEQPVLQVEEISPEVTSPESEVIKPVEEISLVSPIFTPNYSKFLIIGAVILIFFILIFFFFKIFTNKTPTKKITLIYWGLWEDKEVFEPLIKLYQQKNPHINIQYEKMDPHDYRDRLLARSQRGLGPDIFRFHNTWIPEIKQILSKIPQNIMSNKEFEETFYPIHQKDLKVGNYYYGIPLMIDGLVLIYNEQLLKQVGIISPPANWEQVMDYLSKLTVKDNQGQIISAGIAIGTANNIEHFSEIFGLLLLQNGADLNNLDKQEAVDALEIYRKFSEPPNNTWSETMPNSIVAFAQGKVAMILAPSWWVNNIKAINPDIQIKTATIPTVPGGKLISIANYWVEGVSNYSKNQIEAWKFLKFLVDKENLTRLYEEQKKLRVLGEPYSRVDLGNLLIQDPYAGAVIKQAKDFVSLPLVSRTFDNGLNDEIIQYVENAINSTIEGVSYNSAVEQLKKGVDQVLEKYKIE